MQYLSERYDTHLTNLTMCIALFWIYIHQTSYGPKIGRSVKLNEFLVTIMDQIKYIVHPRTLVLNSNLIVSDEIQVT